MKKFIIPAAVAAVISAVAAVLTIMRKKSMNYSA